MSQFRFIVAVAVALFVTQAASLMVAPLLVDIALEFDTSVAVAGQLATATFAAWAISVVTVGPMSDSFGRRPVALTGLSLLCIGTLASAFAPNLGTLMAFRVLTGLGGGMIPPNSLAAIADVVAPSRRAQAVGGIMAFNTLSSVIAIPLLAVAAQWGGWRLPFVITGVTLAACVVLNWFWFPKNEGSGLKDFTFFSRYRTLLAIPIFRAAIVVNFAQRMAFFGLFSYLAAYLIDAYGMSVGAVALPLAFAGLGRVVGSWMAGPVAIRKNRMTLVALFSLAGGIAALLLFLVDFPIWAVVAIAFVAVTMLSIGWPVLITLSTEVSGQSRATGVGMLGFSNQTGGVGGAAIGGVVLAASGFPGIGYLCLGAAIFSSVVITLFMRKAVPQN
ncbi:MAG: MFS transporter [SAR202 cluster bacterium]|nr:MFS transporter [SAR202 cluster bacterium]